MLVASGGIGDAEQPPQTPSWTGVPTGPRELLAGAVQPVQDRYCFTSPCSIIGMSQIFLEA